MLFQSTRPVWGATTLKKEETTTLTEISIHAPRVGRDHQREIQSHQAERFQSTRPVWGATCLQSSILPMRILFQSTRPVWGATPRAPATGATYLFQSTRPVWGATAFDIQSGGIEEISIHAPRVGRDLRARLSSSPTSEFQSTRPVWGATTGCCSRIRKHCISIHAPRVGRDLGL